MKFTVVWSEEAEARLADIWLNAPHYRNEISELASRIDAILRDVPHEVGESREGKRRIVYEPPLGAAFSVNQDDRIVLVLENWRY